MYFQPWCVSVGYLSLIICGVGGAANFDSMSTYFKIRLTSATYKSPSLKAHRRHVRSDALPTSYRLQGRHHCPSPHTLCRHCGFHIQYPRGLIAMERALSTSATSILKPAGEFYFPAGVLNTINVCAILIKHSLTAGSIVTCSKPAIIYSRFVIV